MWLPAPLLVLANRVDRQQLTLSLPLSEQVSRQYTRRWRAAMLLLGTGAVGLVALPVLRTPWLLVAALLAGIAGAVSFVLARRRLPRLTVDEAGVAKLVGVSPEFRDALVVEATAGPGDGH